MAYLYCGLSSHTRISFLWIQVGETSGWNDKAAPFCCPWFPQQLELNGLHQKRNGCPDLSFVSPWATGAWECSRDAVLPQKFPWEHLKKTKLSGGCGMSEQHRSAVKLHVLCVLWFLLRPLLFAQGVCFASTGWIICLSILVGWKNKKNGLKFWKPR